MAYRLGIDPNILTRYPSYSALIIYAFGLENGPGDGHTTAVLREAEQYQRQQMGDEKPANHPHIAAWRQAYQNFGAKPSKYPCSVEALLSRTLRGQDLPSINRVVDLYNAISIKYVLPVGGEDLDKLDSDLTLRFADGTEPFVTQQAGEEVVSYPAPGEVIWADRSGVTCRMWNWRQCRRTLVSEQTRNVYFVLDRLAPYPGEVLQQAGEELIRRLGHLSPSAECRQEWLGAR